MGAGVVKYSILRKGVISQCAMVELLNVKHFARLLATIRAEFILAYCIYLPFKKSQTVVFFPYSLLHGSR